MRAYIGLGSNVGDRLGSLRAGRAALEKAVGTVVAASSVYKTAPQGDARGQPDFLNACVAIDTDLGPEQLLDACKAIEGSMGREPQDARHAPRAIDLDVLLLGDLVHRSGRLTVPHPEIGSRRFVLAPLLEIDRGLELPDGTRLADLLPDVEGQRVERVGKLT